MSVTFRIGLCGVILYLASLWQRPLFLAEFAGSGGPLRHVLTGTSPAPGEWLLYLPLKLLGLSPFAFRLGPALLTLLAALCIYRAG